MFRHKQGEEKKKQRVYWSNFILTINPSKAYTTKDDVIRERDRLKGVLRDLFSRFEDFVVVKGQAQKAGLSFSDIYIDGEIESGIEIGKEKKRLHSHSLIKMQLSKPHVHIDLAALRETLKEEYGYAPYVQVKYVRNSFASVTDYIHKEYIDS